MANIENNGWLCPKIPFSELKLTYEQAQEIERRLEKYAELVKHRAIVYQPSCFSMFSSYRAKVYYNGDDEIIKRLAEAEDRILELESMLPKEKQIPKSKKSWWRK